MQQPKLTKKLQVLLSDEEVELINSVILNDAIRNNTRPISISAFIRNAVRTAIDQRSEAEKQWDPTNNKKLKSK